MERNQEKNIVAWFEKTGRKPLIIRGARQVGKSTLVRRAATRLGVKLWEINLERFAQLNDIFGSFNVKQILLELSISSGVEGIGDGAGILFLDEIQATPKALAALRYFYEDRPDIAVVSAGSLLEFILSDYSYSMPVGRVEYLWLGPVTFAEYLKAAAPNPVFQAFTEWKVYDEISNNLHIQLTSYLREFLLCGGMPEAASNFAEHHNAQLLRDIHLSILETYRDDFGKYAKRAAIDEVRRVFDYIPAGIGRKIKYSLISPNAKAAEVRKAFDLLVNAGIIMPVFHSDGTGIPLSVNTNESCVKPLFLDVGLVQTALNMPLLTLDAFSESRFVNEGCLAEQIVGQELYFRDLYGGKPSLHYWLRESKSTNAEVDYLIQCGMNIIPVEVKAGTTGSLRSLHQFMALRESPFAVRFDLNPPSEQIVSTTVITSDSKKMITYKLISLPIYFAGRLESIIKQTS
jgi:predicted AAA+ superfamily ATPase